MGEHASFGAWIQRRRRALDLTQAELAEQIGCALGTIRKIEADERRPSKQLAARLAAQLQLAPKEQALFLKAARAEAGVDRLAPPARPADPAPAQTRSAHRANLPAQPNPLIGRGRELAALAMLLRRPDVRVVTLSGPGGTGKTRLALQAAAELLGDFADGCYFVNLAPISDSALVAATIAHALGVSEVVSRLVEEDLHAFLRAKRALLLLDNFEQVLDAAPVVAELLAAAPGLKILVTSRAVLRLYGEHEFAVPPLALPSRANLESPHSSSLITHPLTQYDAVKLFIARAQAVKADFIVTNEHALAVAEICYRLDGLPLAIELAAVRIKFFSPDALLARLERRLQVLTSGPRDLPVRQQTLRNTIDWSYNLLDPVEQVLFRRLAVFEGGCTLEAAEAVASELSIEHEALSNAAHERTLLDARSSMLGLLESLTDKSLLRHSEGPGGEPRFAMLETVSEYALERLEESGEAEAIRRRHADYFTALAEAGEPHRFAATQSLWLGRLDADHDNMRAALSWSMLATARTDIGARLAGALRWYWYIRGYRREGQAWIERMLQKGVSVTAPTRAKLLYSAGSFQSDWEQASVFVYQALALWRELGDKPGMAEALLLLGRLARSHGYYERSGELVRESLALFREQQITWGIIWALLSLGDVALDQGDAAEALGPVEEVLTLTHSLGNTYGNMWARYLMGKLAHLRGDLALAATLLDESLAWLRTLRSPGVFEILNDLGQVALDRGDTELAAALFGECLQLSREPGNDIDITFSLVGLAGVAAEAGQPARAARLLGMAKAVRGAMGRSLTPVERIVYDRYAASVRLQLDDATFEAMWVEGQQLSLEQAKGEAINGIR